MSKDKPESPQDDTSDASDAPKPARFEQALAELEELVENLEKGDLSLEDSLQQFERGVSLARECRDSLAAAEQKVQVLLEKEGESGSLEDFDTEADDS